MGCNDRKRQEEPRNNQEISTKLYLCNSNLPRVRERTPKRKREGKSEKTCPRDAST